MFVAASELLSSLVAVLLMGVVIKLVDDYLDGDHSADSSLAERLGRGVFAYGLLLFALAASLDPAASCTLFLAAYAVGMIKDPGLVLPTRLPGWAETVAAMTLGSWLWGWLEMFSSLSVMVAVQLADDFWDREEDRKKQQFNLANYWGSVETLFLALIMFYISLLLYWEKTVMVAGLIPVVHLVVGWKKVYRGG